MSETYYEDVRRILESGEELPAKVTNRMILAVLAELHRLAETAAIHAAKADKQTEDNREAVEKLGGRIEPLEKIVYGAVKLVLATVVLALLALVVTSAL